MNIFPFTGRRHRETLSLLQAILDELRALNHTLGRNPAAKAPQRQDSQKKAHRADGPRKGESRRKHGRGNGGGKSAIDAYYENKYL